MLGFADSFLVWLGATLVPAFLGLFIIVWVGNRVRPIYTAAFGLGIFFWFFFDTIGGAASLAVSDGFEGGTTQAAIVGLFTVGLLLFFWADADRNIFNAELASGKYGLAIPVLVAIAVGIHGLGEGSAFGTAAATTPTSLLDTFGGVNAGIAYVLHKGLEPMMIGACYSVYSSVRSSDMGRRLKDIVSLSVLFALPSLLGAAGGYFIAFETPYFFALGAGTSIYAAVRLAAPLFSSDKTASRKDSTKLAIALLLGFLAIYVAALFHA